MNRHWTAYIALFVYLTLCEQLVEYTVETAQHYHMGYLLGPMEYHIPRSEFGHYLPAPQGTMVRCCRGDKSE